MDLHSLTAAIPVGFGSDFDSQAVKLVYGPSQSGSFFEHNSDAVFRGHVYYTTACRHVEHSAAKHQQIQKLHSPYGHGHGQTRLPLFATCHILTFTHLYEKFPIGKKKCLTERYCLMIK
ncbi:hypothetical protein AVEN_177062-1 [Araneus ventricosus]|uniref:Uncharacterized protein n=1 Tax=Araneus ventricosus TaxID=182803 RepID=A0A4Y2CTA3_ARAVE|nr:hypothetical protein AVEN_177062-1 [Araneus ventricosus]